MAAFLRIYSQTGRVSVAAKAAGIARCTHYRKLATDAKYREAFNQAEHEAGQELEDEAVRRALGIREPTTYKGKIVRVGRRTLYHTRYSDMLLLALLRRFRPALYRDHAVITTEHTGSVDVVVERLQAARQRLRETRAAAG
jgi:hypothetical protein